MGSIDDVFIVSLNKILETTQTVVIWDAVTLLQRQYGVFGVIATVTPCFVIQSRPGLMNNSKSGRDCI